MTWRTLLARPYRAQPRHHQRRGHHWTTGLDAPGCLRIGYLGAVGGVSPASALATCAAAANAAGPGAAEAVILIVITNRGSCDDFPVFAPGTAATAAPAPASAAATPAPAAAAPAPPRPLGLATARGERLGADNERSDALQAVGPGESLLPRQINKLCIQVTQEMGSRRCGG